MRFFKKSDGILCQSKRVKFAFIAKHQKDFSVAWLCRRLQIQRSGYYAWRRRPQRTQLVACDDLVKAIKASHKDSGGIYGSPRVLADVHAQGFRVGRNSVIAVMRENNLFGRKKRRFKITTQPDKNARVHDNKLQQNFSRSQPNRAWVTDITYVQTLQGWLYFSVIIDLFSRRIVGYAVDNHMRTSLAETSLMNAIEERKPAKGILHHSDRGCQYTSNDYVNLLTQQGFEISMSGKGNCFDNAVAESFFASFKKETLYRLPLQDDESCITLIDDYVQFYNCKRRHSALNYLSPIDWELKASIKEGLLV